MNHEAPPSGFASSRASATRTHLRCRLWRAAAQTFLPTITQRTRSVATAYGTDIRGNRWSAQDSVLVRTSHRCVTVAGVQDVEACMAMEEGIDAGHRLYLPITQR